MAKVQIVILTTSDDELRSVAAAIAGIGLTYEGDGEAVGPPTSKEASQSSPADKVDDKVEDDSVDLAKMNVAALKEHAAKLEIDIQGLKKKADIIAAIENGGKVETEIDEKDPQDPPKAITDASLRKLMSDFKEKNGLEPLQTLLQEKYGVDLASELSKDDKAKLAVDLAITVK